MDLTDLKPEEPQSLCPAATSTPSTTLGHSMNNIQNLGPMVNVVVVSPSPTKSNSVSSSSCYSDDGISEDHSPSIEHTLVVLSMRTCAKKQLLIQFKNAILALDGATMTFAHKIAKLSVVWRIVVALVDHSTTDALDNLMHSILRHTLHAMLMGQWTTSRAIDRQMIRNQIELCLPLVHSSRTVLHRCRYILKHLERPWDHPILQRLMGLTAPVFAASCNSLLEAEEIEYLTEERICMIALRLQKLCESRLYETACSLAANSIRALRQCPADHTFRVTALPAQSGYVHDMHLLLLYRLRRYGEMMDNVRNMDLADAVVFCERNSSTARDTSIELTDKRLIRDREHMFDSVLLVFLTRFLAVNGNNSDQSSDNNYDARLRVICSEWIRRNVDRNTFNVEWRHLIALVGSFRHFYILLDVLQEFRTVARGLADDKLELLCRGMTHELNQLEHMKTDATIGAPTILLAEQRIAPRFLELARYFDDFPELARELALTSFSLHPMTDTLAQLQAYAEATRNQPTNRITSKSDLEDECPIHYDIWTPASADATATVQAFIECQCGTRCVVRKITCYDEDEKDAFLRRVGALHSVTGGRFVESDGYDSLAAPNLILDAIERMPYERRLDMLTLISAPRIKNLSWLMDWTELRCNCLALLGDNEKMQRAEHMVATANNHLEFLSPNYQRYRHLDAHEYPGIESGYEVFYRDGGGDGGVDTASVHQQLSDIDGVGDEPSMLSRTFDAQTNNDSKMVDPRYVIDADTSSASESERAIDDIRERERQTAMRAAAKRRRFAHRERRTTAAAAAVASASGTDATAFQSIEQNKEAKGRPRRRLVARNRRQPTQSLTEYANDGVLGSQNDEMLDNMDIVSEYLRNIDEPVIEIIETNANVSDHVDQHPADSAMHCSKNNDTKLSPLPQVATNNVSAVDREMHQPSSDRTSPASITKLGSEILPSSSTLPSMLLWSVHRPKMHIENESFSTTNSVQTLMQKLLSSPASIGHPMSNVTLNFAPIQTTSTISNNIVSTPLSIPQLSNAETNLDVADLKTPITRPDEINVTSIPSKPTNCDDCQTPANMRYFPDKEESFKTTATNDTNQTNITNDILKTDNDSTEHVDTLDIDFQSANAGVSALEPPFLSSPTKMVKLSSSINMEFNQQYSNNYRTTGSARIPHPRKRVCHKVREPAACRVKLERLTPELIAWWTRCIPVDSGFSRIPQQQVRPQVRLTMCDGEPHSVVGISSDKVIGMQQHDPHRSGEGEQSDVTRNKPPSIRENDSAYTVDVSRWIKGGTVPPMNSCNVVTSGDDDDDDEDDSNQRIRKQTSTPRGGDNSWTFHDRRHDDDEDDRRRRFTTTTTTSTSANRHGSTLANATCPTPSSGSSSASSSSSSTNNSTSAKNHSSGMSDMSEPIELCQPNIRNLNVNVQRLNLPLFKSNNATLQLHYARRTKRLISNFGDLKCN